MKLIDRITINPKQMSGQPCIRNLRIPIVTILNLYQSGISTEQILQSFPDLDKQDIKAALCFNALLTKKDPKAILRTVKTLHKPELKPPYSKYPLVIDTFYSDITVYCSKGHQDIKKFCNAIRKREDPDFNSDNEVKHLWAKWEFIGHPDEDPGHCLRTTSYRRGIRGEFPCTYVEVY